MAVRPTHAQQQTPEGFRSHTHLFPPQVPPRNESDDGEHLVQFYQTDDALVTMLSNFIEIGLSVGDPCLIIATAPHLARLEDYLQAKHLDFLSAQARGAYHTFDADEILAQVMVDGMPERERVRNVLESLLASTAQDGPWPRIFGEVAVQLWAKGNLEAAIRLEELCNELRQITPFTLLCAYPMHLFAGVHSQEPFTTLCHQHSRVRPDESYPVLSREEEQLRAIALFQQKAASLEAEIQEREKLERQKEGLINMVTHELKTPLTALQGNLQLVQRRLHRLGSCLPPDQEEPQKVIEGVLSLLSHGQQLLGVQNRLITDLLDVAHLQRQALELHLMPCNVIRFLLDLVQDYRAAHPHRLITLELPEQEVLLLQVDQDRIGQVIGNYLTNALKYSPLDTAIHVGLDVSSSVAHLWVQDHGPGLAPEAQQRIWEQFYQVPGIPTQSAGGPSLGLGLYICQQLIESHHGQVGVESADGQGARFWFRLPLHLSDA